MHFDEFLQRFPDAEWLEVLNGKERWSDMEGEGSLYESMWFCSDCGDEVSGPHDDDHECDD